LLRDQPYLPQAIFLMLKRKQTAVKSSARPKTVTLPVEMTSQDSGLAADTQLSCVLPCPCFLKHISTTLSFEIASTILCNLSRSNSSLLDGLDFVAQAQAAASFCLVNAVAALMNDRC
jgi:hypothetical protein